MADDSPVRTIQAEDGTTLVEIAAAPNSDEADLICGFLESEGIPARVESHVSEEDFTLLCDAQTSGGLLMAVPREKVAAFEERFRSGGLFCANIGSLNDRSGTITVRP